MTTAQAIVVALGIVTLLLGVFAGRAFIDPYALTTTAQKARRWLGIGLLILGLYVTAGAFFEPQPLAPGQGLPWQDEAAIDPTLTQAKAENKPVMLDFWSKSCTNCKVLERETLLHPTVAPTLRADFALLKVNTDVLYEADRPRYDAFKQAFGNIDNQPYVVFLNARGEFLPDLSFHGLKSAEELLPILPTVADAAPGGESGEGGLARQIEEDGLLAVLLLVFLGGLAASLTPCVYPLIPITISVFGAREATSRLQAFGLSTVYVGGIVLTYTALGLVAASVGKGIGEAMKSPWVLVGLAALMIAMGLSSLGLYEIGLPTSLQTRLSMAGGKGALGALIMGLVAGLVATPCVGPILVTVLVFVAQTQDLALGALLLATFALGMGMLFLVLGTFAGLLSRLPRSGPWMVAVKTAFGAVFFVVALYYLRLALPFVKAPIEAAWSVAGLLT